MSTLKTALHLSSKYAYLSKDTKSSGVKWYSTNFDFRLFIGSSKIDYQLFILYKSLPAAPRGNIFVKCSFQSKDRLENVPLA